MNGRDGAGASYTFDTTTLSGDGSNTNNAYGVNTNYIATRTWVGECVDTASAAALSQAKTWVNQQNFATSAGLAANTRYEMTNTGWTSAIKIQVDTQVPTDNDGILHIILES